MKGRKDMGNPEAVALRCEKCGDQFEMDPEIVTDLCVSCLDLYEVEVKAFLRAGGWEEIG
jgi:hypothetical protein